jgi:hypothetical protein
VRRATFGLRRKPISRTRVLARTQTNSSAMRNGSQRARIEGPRQELCTSRTRSLIQTTPTSGATTRIPSSFLFLADGSPVAEGLSSLTMARCSSMFLWTGPLERKTRGGTRSSGGRDFQKLNDWWESQRSSPLRSQRDFPLDDGCIAEAADPEKLVPSRGNRSTISWLVRESRPSANCFFFLAFAKRPS